jgi:mono/diheme cytochrome c family protein/DNA-binding beta-propeller fold protein YncE
MYRLHWLPVLVATLSISSISGIARGDEAVASVSYYRDVRPILQVHCQGCHQPAKPGGGAILTDHAGLLKAGDSELPIVTPGKVDESSLLEQISAPEGETPAMPKDAPPLKPVQVDLIRRWIEAGAPDDTPVTAQEMIDAEHPPKYEQAPVITALEFSPDGALLAVSGYHEVLLWKVDGSELVARLVGLSERVESLAFSPDGAKLAVTGGSPSRFGEVQIWSVADRKLLFSQSVTYDTLYGASWSPDGTKLSFGCGDNTLRAIDATTGAAVLYQGAHSDWVLDTVFSAAGTHVVSVSRDQSMKLTELATQRFEDNITSITPGALKGGLASVDRHPTKDELLIGGADGMPKIYKMFRTQNRQIGDDFNKLREFEAMPGRVYSVAYSTDGNKIIAGSSSDGTGEVRVYDANDSQLICKLKAAPGPVFAVDLSPDAAIGAAAGFDGKLRLFDAATGEVKREFVPVPVEGNAVALTAEVGATK